MNKSLSRIGCLLAMTNYVKGMKWQFAGVVVVNLLFKATPLVISFLGAYLVSAAVLGDLHYVSQLAVAIVVLAIVAGVLAYADVLVAHEVAYRVLSGLREAAYDKVDEIAPAAMEGKRSGEIVSIVLEDVEVLEQFYAHVIPQLVVAFVVPLSAMVAAAFIHPLIPLSLLPFVVGLMAIPFRAAKTSDAQGARSRKAFGIMNAHVVDGVQGSKDIISNQWQKRYFSRFEESMQEYHSSQMSYALRSANEQRLFALVSGLGGLVAQIVTIVLMLQGSLDAVWLLPVFVLSSAVFAPLRDALSMSSNYGLIVGAAQRVFGLFQSKPSVEDSGKLVESDILAAESKRQVTVSFNDVVFSYPPDDFEESQSPALLTGLSFSVSTGETVALVGASGCGKTTSARLLQRFWDVDSGNILINGSDVRDLKLTTLRNLVTVVPQETYLFNASITDNLKLAKLDADKDSIAQAIREACLDDVVEKLPDGIDTKVGERGLRLSGGEKQRIAIAQAFLKDSPILVLDEASANLDSETERRINEAVNRLRQGRATLVIAHRASTIRAADRIVVIRDGRTEAEGSYSELKDSCPYFSKLMGEEYGNDHGE